MQEFLNSRLSIIVEHIEKHFLHQFKISDSSDAYFEFHDKLLAYLPNAIQKYRMPDTVDGRFKVVSDFINKFISSKYYRGTCLDAYNKYKKHLQREVPFVSAQEAAEGKGICCEQIPDTRETPMERVVRLDLEERAERGYNHFATLLTVHELIAFRLMRIGSSTPAIVDSYREEGRDISIEQVKYLRKILEYRLLCFFAEDRNRLYDKEIVLKAMNKYPELNKRFFNDKKLLSLPDDSALHATAVGKFKKESNIDEIALAYDAKAKKAADKNYAYSSCIDFNGKKHDHAVVFINNAGYAYDHVTRETKTLN